MAVFRRSWSIWRRELDQVCFSFAASSSFSFWRKVRSLKWLIFDLCFHQRCESPEHEQIRTRNLQRQHGVTAVCDRLGKTLSASETATFFAKNRLALDSCCLRALLESPKCENSAERQLNRREDTLSQFYHTQGIYSIRSLLRSVAWK